MTPYPASRSGQPKRDHRLASVLFLFMLLSLLLSACGTPPATLSQANKSKTSLDQKITHARNTGVPAGLLQPIIDSEKSLSKTTPPSDNLFSNQTGTDYYTSLARHYDALTNQLGPLETQTATVNGKLKQFNDTINTMKLYGMDTTTVQQQMTTTESTFKQVKSLSDFQKIPGQIDSAISTVQPSLLTGQAKYTVQQFHQEVTRWGKANQYHDSYNGQSYILDFEYDQQGIGSTLDDNLSAAQSPKDYQAVLDLAKSNMTNLKAMEANAKDSTSWNKPHATDTQLMQYYNVAAKQVIVVSLLEQTIRVYQDSQLIKAFQVVTGQFDKPSLPGLWSIDKRQSPTIFKASEPQGSVFWYPDTNINFAMGYYSAEGYFLHDSWWRQNYGPNTEFPHYDTGGDQLFAFNGSHGCINIAENDASWLYNNASPMGTPVIIY